MVLKGKPRPDPPIPDCYRKHEVIFSQGDPADTVCHLLRGHVKLRVVSPQGKEAVIGILGPGQFFGEGCLAGQAARTATAVALDECSVLSFRKADWSRALRKQPRLGRAFLAHLLSRNVRLEDDLLDQLFNSSEQRLARVLLLLADLDEKSESKPVELRLSQETLASMVGTTRSRVSLFMNKFRKLGLIEYKRGLTVRGSLRTIVPHD